MTVHVAIGTDIIHMHPAASGAAIGEGSLRDFRYFVSNVARLERRRVPELRIGGGAAGGVPESGGARAEPGASLDGLDDGEHRFHADVPAADQRRDPARSPASARAIRSSATTRF